LAQYWGPQIPHKYNKNKIFSRRFAREVQRNKKEPPEKIGADINTVTRLTGGRYSNKINVKIIGKIHQPSLTNTEMTARTLKIPQGGPMSSIGSTLGDGLSELPVLGLIGNSIKLPSHPVRGHGNNSLINLSTAALNNIVCDSKRTLRNKNLDKLSLEMSIGHNFQNSPGAKTKRPKREISSAINIDPIIESLSIGMQISTPTEKPPKYPRT
jgi:hypothetical protein